MPSPTMFRIGEHISYTVSFQNFKNAAFVETNVVSRGSISGRDVVELNARFKTQGVVSAAFSLIDESRVIYAAPDSGEPLVIKRSLLGGVLPREVLINNIATASSGYDLITAVFRARETAGSGTFTLVEEGQTSSLTFAPSGSERVETDAGPFDATISSVTGPFLDSHDVKDLKIWFSTDEAHIPVAFQFKTKSGDFRGRLASYSIEQPVTIATPVPTPAKTPIPTPTPRPTPVPPPVYVPNKPLLPELGFELGEELTYKVTRAGAPVGVFTLLAKERKLVNARDTLILMAQATGVDPGSQAFGLGDVIVAAVGPDDLAPRNIDVRLTRALAPFSHSASIDQRTGIVTAGPNRYEGPIGVHSLLSLVYAMRSFNLKPSKDESNPVNDTRVAVFWRDQVRIWVLRPGNSETIKVLGFDTAAQPVTIVTRDTAIDQAGLKVWLSNEPGRVPVRFSLGSYQADLVAKAVRPLE